jgi:hypothetical protein
MLFRDGFLRRRFFGIAASPLKPLANSGLRAIAFAGAIGRWLLF